MCHLLDAERKKRNQKTEEEGGGRGQGALGGEGVKMNLMRIKTVELKRANDAEKGRQ